MSALAFAGGVVVPSILGRLPSNWPAALVVCLCLALAGGMMLFFPDRAFRTDRKPRWLGLPIFCVGLLGAFEWLARLLS